MPTTTATTVSPSGSNDGPAVTTSPQLLAYYKVEAEGPEQAVELAKRIPHARFGAIEVRQVVKYD